MSSRRRKIAFCHLIKATGGGGKIEETRDKYDAAPLVGVERAFESRYVTRCSFYPTGFVFSSAVDVKGHTTKKSS